MKKLIDVHSHFLSKEYIQFLEENNATLEDGFPLPQYDLEEHKKLMETSNIEHAFLSISTPQPYFAGQDKESIDMCRLLNEQMASIKERENHIGYFACLPLPNIEASISEAIYALDSLHADGIKLASNSRGLYLGDKKLEPLMEVMNERHTVCVIHPHKPEPIKEDVFSASIAPLYEFLADTTRAVLNMIASGVVINYPNITWVIPHCGSFLPNIYNRFIGISKVIDLHNIDVKESFSKLYYDLSGITSKEALDLLLTITTKDYLLYGSDYPFTPINQIENNLNKLPEVDFYENAKKILKF